VLGLAVRQLDVAGLDGELAPVRHGVAGIHDQVHDDLLELARIGFDPPQRGRKDGPQRDVLADQAAKHGFHVLHDGVEVEDLGLEHLLAAEGEELAGQLGGAHGRLPEELDVATHRVLGTEPLEQEVAPTEHDGHEVVEVVRDAAGEAPHRLHLL